MNRSVLILSTIKRHSRCLAWKLCSKNEKDFCLVKDFLFSRISSSNVHVYRNYANYKPKHELKDNEHLQEEEYNDANKMGQARPSHKLNYEEEVLKKSKESQHGTSSSIKLENRLTSPEVYQTVVHKYSPIPSLPQTPSHKLSLEIPQEPSSEEVPSAIHRFLLGKFRKYLDRFHKSLADEMPDTFHMFSTFTNGFKEFVIDFRDYIAVVIKLSLPFYNLEDLGRRELELYFNMPRQMIRVFPVVAISSLPFAQNFVLPFAYMVPRHLLCYQFWDAKQRQEFPVFRLQKRLFNARPVFRSMQSRVDEIHDHILRRKCQSIFFSLGSGVHPTVKQIMEVRDLFVGEPFHLNLLYAQHVNGLLRLHGRSAWFRRRSRLREHARYIHCLDTALMKEGLSSLDVEQLRKSMVFRGINPTEMSEKQMRSMMDTWLGISGEIDERSFSLLLHLPIFLAYNHPMNLHLIYT